MMIIEIMPNCLFTAYEILGNKLYEFLAGLSKPELNLEINKLINQLNIINGNGNNQTTLKLRLSIFMCYS